MITIIFLMEMAVMCGVRVTIDVMMQVRSPRESVNYYYDTPYHLLS